MKDEIDTGRKRRSFARAFKRQVIEETLVPGASVSGVALRHGLNNNMVFKWRREYLRRHASVPTRPVKLLPVSMVADYSGEPSCCFPDRQKISNPVISGNS